MQKQQYDIQKQKNNKQENNYYKQMKFTNKESSYMNSQNFQSSNNNNSNNNNIQSIDESGKIQTDRDSINSSKAVIIKTQSNQKSKQSTIQYEYIMQSHNLIYLIAQSQIESFAQFNELFLMNQQQIYNLQLIIENSELIQYTSKLHHKIQSVFQLDNQIKTKIYDQMIKKKESREFIENQDFIKNIDGVSFYQLQTIHTTSELYQQTFKQYFDCQPRIIKNKLNMRLIIQLRTPNQKGDIIRGEIIMSLSLKNIQNINNLSQRSDFQDQARSIKYKILELIQTNEWQQLFNKFQDITYRCYLQDSIQQILITKMPILTTQQIQNGLNICKYQDVQYVDIMTYILTALNKQNSTLDIKRILNNPTNLQKSNIINYYPWNGFIFSPKADGIRCLLVSRGYQQYLIKEMKLQRLPDSQFQEHFIVEAEQVGNELLCYDILLFNGDQLVDQMFSSRLKQLQKFIEYMKKGNNLFGQQYQVKMKDFAIIDKNVNSAQLKQIFEQLLEQKYQTDGLIINTDNTYYKQQIYKWKPKELLSIDLYVKQIDRNKIPGGFDPEKVDQIPMVLFTHISSDQFHLFRFETLIKIQNPSQIKNIILIPFQPALCPNCFIYWRNKQDEQQEQIDGKVCEFSFNTDQQEWIFLRIRSDKNPQKGQFGNYFSTAEYTFHDIIDYIDLQMLYDVSLTNEKYFQIDTQLQYRQMTQYMNFIKRIVINYVCNPQLYTEITIMDFGIGKGQDLNKYAANRVQKIIGIDNDFDAIKELVQRKNTSTKIKYPTIQLGVYNLSSSEDIDKLINTYQKQNIHALFSMFSIHYFMSNFEYLLNAFNLVKQGGFVVIICMDGQKIFDMLADKKQGDSIQFVENSKIKYQYQKQYSNNTLLESNQFIKLKLPFSEHLMQEQLVNIQYLIKRMKQRNFTLNQDFSCDLQGTYNYFSKDDLAHTFREKEQLSPTDLQHISLYRVLIFKKKQTN